jgi:outer membrane protein OmpA-like peptidoglycan-associated protein
MNPNVNSNSAISLQSLFMSEMLSHRRLDYPSDASAVGWNPALLGTRPYFDMNVGLAFGSDNRNTTTKFGIFAKVSGFGLGYTLNPSIKGSSGELYAGYGLRILDDILWAGASVRYALSRNPYLDYNASLLYKPLQGLLVSASATTMKMDTYTILADQYTRIAPNLVQFTASAAYSFSPTLALLAAVRSHSLTNIEQPSLELGASWSLLDATVVLTGNLQVLQPAFRLGVEINSDILDIGYSGTIAAQSSLANILFARFSGDKTHTFGQLRDSRMDREFCSGSIHAEYEQSSSFLRAMPELNPLLTESLAERGFAVDSAGLFDKIRRQFYTRPRSSTDSLRGNTTFSAVQNYWVETKRTNYARFPRISTIVRVTDSLGKTVEGLTAADFRDASSTSRIISVQKLDTSVAIPIDIVMLIDCSGSMGDKIKEVREKIDVAVSELRASGADVHLGGILYGTEILNVLQPTDRYDRFDEFLARAVATQHDEYTPGAIDELLGIKFRPEAERVGIVISDELTYTNRRPFVREALAIKDLWEKRISLMKIIKPCENNGASTAYLTLGREYDITSPFTSVLSSIGKETTTLYAITSEPTTTQETTQVFGTVSDVNNRPVQAFITLTDTEAEQTVIGPFATNPDGSFAQGIIEGRKYRMLVQPVNAGDSSIGVFIRTLDASQVRKGGTLRQTVTLQARTIVRGVVRDGIGRPLQADIFLRDNFGYELPVCSTERATNGTVTGRYEAALVPGRKYTIRAVPVASATYQSLEYELDTRGFPAGNVFEQIFTMPRLLPFVQIEGSIRFDDSNKVETALLDGQNLRGRRITVKNQATQELVAWAETVTNGNYTFRLPKGISAEITLNFGDGYAPERWRAFVRKTDTATVLSHASILRKSDVGEWNQEEEEAKRDLNMTLTNKKTVKSAEKSASVDIVLADNLATKNLPPTTKRSPKIPETQVPMLSFSDGIDVLPIVIDSTGKVLKMTWQTELDSLANQIKREMAQLMTVVITGHTDDRASVEVNRSEGWQRANFIVKELISRGVPATLLVATSQGNSQLLPRRKKESVNNYRTRCRRVEVMKIWKG